MGTQDLIKLIKRLGVVTKIYPLSIPTDAEDTCILLETGDGTDSRGDVADFMLLLTVRSKHPATSEALGLELLQKLKNVTNQTAGETQIILISAQQKIPQFVGKDDNGFYYFETNFTVLAS